MSRHKAPNQRLQTNSGASQRRASRWPFWIGIVLVVLATSLAAALVYPKAGEAAPLGSGFDTLADEVAGAGPGAGIPVVDAGSWLQRTIRNIVDAARYISDKADKLIDKVSKKVGDVAFKNGLKVFLGKIAEDTATWVASAGTGQKPLFVTDPHYFKDLGNAAAGDYLDSLSKEKFGVSLCDPGAFKVTLDIALRVNLNPNFCKEACQQNYASGLEDEEVDVITTPAAPMVPEYIAKGMPLSEARKAVAYLQNPPAGASVDPWNCKATVPSNEECLAKYNEAIARAEEKISAELKQCNSMCAANKRKLASCTLNQIEDNAKQGLLSSGLTVNGQSTNITGATLQEAYKSGELPKIFRPDQNPLGMFLTATAETQAANAAKQQEEKDILSFNSIFPLRSIISGKVKTPGSLTTETTNQKLNPDDPTLKQTGTPVADAFGFFTNTLTSKLIERFLKKGILDDRGTPRNFTSGTGIISRSSSGVQAAKERFASLGQVAFGTGGGIDILNELSACPVDASSVTETSLGIVLPNNCVLDPAFRQAIEERLTVKEALARGLLSDKKIFGFDANGREPDFRNGYPYRSLVVLRKYRIIPVGWELAAQHIRDYEKQNVSLSTIISQFDDPTSAYYRLVDPSWVLKAPENICLRTGFTESVVSDEYVDADGDEVGGKNIDYTKRYCKSGSDLNIGQVCTCKDGNITADDQTACVSTFLEAEAANKTLTKGKCTEEVTGEDPKAECAYITPRVRQVQRREACVADQSCILEDDSGACKQYGTCVEERDAWRFNGQSCNEQYASCATFTEPAGTQVSYLQNTLQKSVCGPGNAGCQQYCSQYNYTTNTWACTVAAAETRRFDRDLQSCDPAADGCTQFIRQTTGTNLVPNGGFELGSVANAAQNVNFEGWRAGDTSQSCGAQTFTSTDAIGGTQAARVQWVEACGGSDPAHYLKSTFDTGTPLASRTFTVSFNAKAEGASCVVDTVLTSGTESSVSAKPTVTPEWQRFSYAYTFLSTQARSDLTLFFNAMQNCTYLLDNVQVEEGAGLTDYKDYGAVNLAHLKRPPADVGNDLGCTGNPATDPAACSKFIAKCSVGDVGCDLFTPVAGGINVPAKPGQSCPADKVGCASFREQPTSGALDSHPTRTGMYCNNVMATEMRSCSLDSDCGVGVPAGTCAPLVSFIGTSGKQCTAQDVGCEAYTNLDEVAKGGEGKAQFTTLQFCVPPAPLYTGALKNYYAWVGNEESGYQLKKYILVPSNVGGGTAPCTNLAHDTLACQDGSVYNAATNPAGNIIDCQAEFGKNPDCSQYYDDNGVITYRLRSRVIEQTESCHPYRNEVDTNTYYADSTRSLSCSAAVIGCREYVGNTGSNTRTLFTSDFENGSYSPWILGTGSDITTESLTLGGHSVRAGSVSGSNNTMQYLTENSIRSAGSYLVEFWARTVATDPNPVAVRLEDPTGYRADFGTVQLTPTWQRYRLGSVTYAGASPGSFLALSSTQGSFYIDNVTLTEITDSTYKVKASQTVCGGFEGCSAYRNRAGQVTNLMSFTKLCQAGQVGCEALINTRNSSTPFAQTVTLPNLRGDVDGSGKIDQGDIDTLRAFLASGGAPPFPRAAGDIDANNTIDNADLSRLTSFVRGTTDAIASATYDGDTVETKADFIEYWVNDSAKACNAEDKGCRALGKQQVNVKKSGSTYAPTLLSTDTVYAKDNPDTYPSTLCGLEALSCEEYATSDGGTAYFRNPAGRSCEYRDATGNASAGWYLQGTNDQCPIQNQGNIPPAVPNGGFAGLCPAEQNGCGTFLDPLGTGESLSTNSGFEVANAAGTAPQNWNTGSSLQAYATRGDGKAVQLSLANGGYFTQTMSLDANTYYVVSAEVQKDPADTNPIRFGLIGCRDVLGAQVRLQSPDRSMIADNSGAYQEVAADRFSDTAFQRLSGRVYSGDAVTCQVFAGTVGTGAGHWFDNLQLRATTNTPVLRQTVDTTSCNGQVGDKLGCHLFNDTSNTALTYDVDQSPQGFKPTDADATGGTATCADQPERCDSNTILKVSRDRTCNQWLAPTTTIESKKATGEKENLVLGVGTCDRFSPSGQCNRYVDEKRCSTNPKQICISDADCGSGVCKPFPLTGNTQAYSREELRNRSGLVVAGLQFGQSCSQDRSKSCVTDTDCGAGNTCLPDQTIKGNFPFGVAPQVGGESVTVTSSAFNGDFSKTRDVRRSGWLMEPKTALSNGKLSVITQQTLGTGANLAPVAVDPYLLLEPGEDQIGWPTVRSAASSLANKLSAGKSYYISFKARFLNTSQVKTSVEVGISSGDDADDLKAWELKQKWTVPVQLSGDWQTYVVGPLKLDPLATAAEGNLVFGTLTPHEKFDPSRGFIFFSYTSDQPALNPNLAIDSVSVLPVLQVRDAVPHSYTYAPVAGDVYIPRTCRAYPNASALTCSYADDTGKQFNGWQGYCLETDPKNSNNCLSWHPLDLLAGERNIFGKVEAAGYSNKSPLYMCLKAEGNYSTKIFNSTDWVDDNSPLWGQQDMYRHPMHTLMSDNAWPNDDDLVEKLTHGLSFYQGGCGIDEICNLRDSGIQTADVEDRNIHKSEIERVAVLYQGGANNDSGVIDDNGKWAPSSGAQACYRGNCASSGAAYFGPTPDGDAYMVFEPSEAEGKCWTANCNPDIWVAEWQGPAEQNGRNQVTFDIVFDTDGYVSGYDLAASDNSHGGGFQAAVIFYLREQCKEIVKVVDTGGENAAWSSNIASSSFSLPNYKYKLSQEDQPFGSIAPPVNFDNPTDWVNIGGSFGWQPLQVKQNTATARAGSAYTCNDSSTTGCNGRMCFGLSADALKTAPTNGYSCDTVTDIQRCTSAGGYCNGFGTAKLCVAGPKASASNPIACSSNTECGKGGVCDYTGSYCSAVTDGKTVGAPCTAATKIADCGSGGVCQAISNTTGGKYAAVGTPAQSAVQAKDRLKVLFADVYGAWKWQPDPFTGASRYVEVPSLISDWKQEYLDMELCNGGSLQRGLIDADPAAAYCGILPQVANLAIGRSTSNTVFINSGEIIQLNFNTIVDKQQLPLKQIAIDWDGGNASDQTVNWGFAPLANTAEPHSISHVYRYGEGIKCYEPADTSGPYYKNANIGGHEYCVARPRVQVQDNWNWCSFTGTVSNPTDGRCPSFPSNDSNYWHQFDGNIVIVRR